MRGWNPGKGSHTNPSRGRPRHVTVSTIIPPDGTERVGVEMKDAALFAF